MKLSSLSILSAVVLSTTISACGSSNSPANGGAINPAGLNLNGNYLNTSATCTAGTVDPAFISFINSGALRLTIAGTTLSVNVALSPTCTMTITNTISSLRNTEMTVLDGATTCSAQCTANECEPEAAPANPTPDIVDYTFANNQLTLTSRTHDDECSDPTGKLISVLTRQ